MIFVDESIIFGGKDVKNPIANVQLKEQLEKYWNFLHVESFAKHLRKDEKEREVLLGVLNMDVQEINKCAV